MALGHLAELAWNETVSDPETERKVLKSGQLESKDTSMPEEKGKRQKDH